MEDKLNYILQTSFYIYIHMKNKLIICLFLLMQGITTIILVVLGINKIQLLIHLIILVLTSGAYIIVSLKNPGNLKPANQQSKAEQLQKDIEPPITDVKMNKKNDKDNQNIISSSKNILEKRHCRLCKIDQPIRTKHCYQCEQCISTFDHHCVWINNCVGQKNRGYFYIYLLVQLAQALQVFGCVVQCSINPQNSKNDSVIFLFIITSISILLLVLFVFHNYLILTNLTTWQFSKWSKISYLNNFQQKQGSPFSKGVIENFKQYWTLTFSQQFKTWEFNKQK